jgi:putative SOS response-associated peptidase YedK
MCGRFYLTAATAEIKKKFNLDQAIELVPRYNIASTQSSLIIVGPAKSRSVHMARLRGG